VAVAEGACQPSRDLYVGNVNRLNAITEQLAQLDVTTVAPAEFGQLKREQQAVYNASVLHEIYFECLGEAPTQPSGVFAQALSRDFGTIDRWKAEFVAMGKALTGGSGLVILAYTPRDKRLINHLVPDHATAPVACAPIIAMDMYEHAWQPDYGGDAGKYVETFVQMIRWITAERLYREAIRV
jgi:Fe-Mn family superoxide dismutase